MAISLVNMKQWPCEGVSISFQTGCLERELQMVQLCH